jgi:hypothetical protein
MTVMSNSPHASRAAVARGEVAAARRRAGHCRIDAAARPPSDPIRAAAVIMAGLAPQARRPLA